MVDFIQRNETTLDVRLGDRAPADIRVGGSDPDRFVPNINIAKWSDEYFLNINHPDIVTAERPTIRDNVADIKIGDNAHSIWPLNQKVLEYKISFDRRPLSNSIRLELLCSEGLSYHKQPPLSQYDIEICEAVRPDNVVNSYAVYAAKANNKYLTGKFCHIYNWVLTDARCRTAWCDLEVVFDRPVGGRKTGRLYILMPPEFLDRAAYPVYAMGAGDTFGITSAGASNESIEDDIAGCVATPSAGTATNISAYIADTSNGSRTGKCGLYKDSDDTHIGSTSEVTGLSSSPAWVDFSCNIAIAAEAMAIVAYSDVGGGKINIYFDTQNGEGRRVENAGYGTWPDPVSWDHDPADKRYSIHCDYTVAGGGLSIPVAMHHLTKNLG